MRALKRLLGRRGEAVEVSEARGVRTLHLGGQAIQSAMRLSAPDRLELAYTRAMMAFLLFAPAPREILMVGLGGGSIARFVHERLPRTRITAIELNPKVLAAARTYFGLPLEDRRLKVIVGDGAEHVPAYRGACDVVLLDAFDNLRSVRSLATAGFYATCRAALRPGGLFVVNFIADEPRLATYVALLGRAFDGRVLRLPSEDRINTIAFAFRDPAGPVRIAALARSARELERRYELPFGRFVRDLAARNAGDGSALRLGGEGS